MGYILRIKYYELGIPFNPLLVDQGALRLKYIAQQGFSYSLLVFPDVIVLENL